MLPTVEVMAPCCLDTTKLRCVLCCFFCFTGLLDFIGKLLTMNKTRFTEAGFDLDLTYITPRVIAMSLPSRGVTAAFRNSMLDVVRCLNYFHRNHFRVANLCSEHNYPLACFPNRCGRFPFPDHNPPTVVRQPKCHAFLASASHGIALLCSNFRQCVCVVPLSGRSHCLAFTNNGELFR